VVSWILAAILVLAPPRASEPNALERYASIAEDIAAETNTRQEAALVLAIMSHESGFRLDVDQGLARGSGKDSCLMQLRNAGEAVLYSRRTCIHEGVRRMRRSLGSCGNLRAYASGTCIGGSKESAAMMGLASRLLGGVS
jgi:hypothetical protein